MKIERVEGDNGFDYVEFTIPGWAVIAQSNNQHWNVFVDTRDGLRDSRVTVIRSGIDKAEAVETAYAAILALQFVLE